MDTNLVFLVDMLKKSFEESSSNTIQIQQFDYIFLHTIHRNLEMEFNNSNNFLSTNCLSS